MTLFLIGLLFGGPVSAEKLPMPWFENLKPSSTVDELEGEQEEDLALRNGESVHFSYVVNHLDNGNVCLIGNSK